MIRIAVVPTIVWIVLNAVLGIILLGIGVGLRVLVPIVVDR